MRHLTDILDFSTEEIDALCNTALDIIESPEKYAEACHGKILGTLFFEPSTRTRLSFTSAMMSLGGNVLGISEPSSSSVAKGETLSDTIRMVSAYTDIIAMRHPCEGAPTVAKRVSSVPIINAGDGGHFHPTQTLTDLLTVMRTKGTFNGLTVGICGDLKYGRTVHSLIAAMSRYEGTRFVLISPDELKLPDYVKEDFLLNGGSPFTETESLEDALPSLDILYMTRIQGERFSDPDEYERLKDSYILTKSKLKYAKSDLTIMHPLPRVTEISVDVDDDPRAAYFVQAENGRYIRMALILKLLSEKHIKTPDITGEEHEDYRCKNPHCISRIERGIKHLFRDGKCIYCDQAMKKHAL